MIVVVRMIALLFFAVAGGCGREPTAPRGAAGPPSTPTLDVLEARWLLEPEALRAAALHAFENPLVQTLMPRRGDSRYGFVGDWVVRAEGRYSDQSSGRVTVLPYCVGGDSTHAFFVTLLERADNVIAETSELIVGRDPTPLEPGFEPVTIAGRVAWLSMGSALRAAGDGAPDGAPARLNRVAWLGCFLANAGTWCEAGGSIARQIAPAVPSAYAIGCTAGTAAAAIFCLIVASK